MKVILALGCSLAVAASLGAGPAAAKDSESWQFVASRGGKTAGRFDVGIVHRDGTIFATGAYYKGEGAVKDRARRKGPAIRAYGELTGDGTLGKYKRWESGKGGDAYWMAFVYEGKTRVRHETGGGSGKVTDLGKSEAVFPLDPGQPQLAFLLASGGNADREVACVSASPSKLGKAKVHKGGEEDVDLPGGGKAKLVRWTVSGDCGSFSVYLDPEGEPKVMLADDVRFDRLPDLPQPEKKGKSPAIPR
jgi:hypothetical protein